MPELKSQAEDKEYHRERGDSLGRIKWDGESCQTWISKIMKKKVIIEAGPTKVSGSVTSLKRGTEMLWSMTETKNFCWPVKILKLSEHNPSSGPRVPWDTCQTNCGDQDYLSQCQGLPILTKFTALHTTNNAHLWQDRVRKGHCGKIERCCVKQVYLLLHTWMASGKTVILSDLI